MDEGCLVEIARREMAVQRPTPTRELGYSFHHGLRTAHIALRLAEAAAVALEASREAIFAAALLHDVAKPAEPHAELGAERLKQLLAGELAPEDLQAAGRIVREHNRRRQADACWAASRIVQDADILDHVGAQGVWLGIYWNALSQERPDQFLDYHLGPPHAAWLAKARDSLSFPAAVAAFDRRVELERRFFERFAAEMAGEP